MEQKRKVKEERKGKEAKGKVSTWASPSVIPEDTKMWD